MKKTCLLIAFSLSCTLLFAQFEVQSTGYSTSSNLVMDGVMGVAGGDKGVLTVKSNRADPLYDSLYGSGLKLITTDSSAGGIFPYSNVCRNKLNFYVTGAGRVYSGSGFLQASAIRTLSIRKRKSVIICRRTPLLLLSAFTI